VKYLADAAEMSRAEAAFKLILQAAQIGKRDFSSGRKNLCRFGKKNCPAP